MPYRGREERIREARMWMRSLAEERVRPSAAVRILREVGLGYRYQEMLSHYREAMAEAGLPDLGRRVRVNAYPPPEVMVRGWERLRTQYASRVIMYARDVSTGEPVRKSFWVGHERRLRVADILSIAYLKIAGGAERYGLTDVRFEYGYTKFRP